MSNNYCVASEIFKLPKEMVDYAVALFGKMCDLQEMEEVDSLLSGDELLRTAHDVYETSSYEMEDGPGFEAIADGPTTLWVSGDEGFNPDTAAPFLQAVLRKFDSDEVLSMEYCWYCDKPRAGEFGGGCFAVSKDNERWMNTGSKSREMEDELRLQNLRPETEEEQP